MVERGVKRLRGGRSCVNVPCEAEHPREGLEDSFIYGSRNVTVLVRGPAQLSSWGCSPLEVREKVGGAAIEQAAG